MKYLGGKARVAKKICSFLESQRKEGQVFVEPFLGGCNILPLMSGERIASEINPDLVLFYKALQEGWTPPTEVSEEEYSYLKNAEPSALRGFVGVACSYSGKWFGGYARSANRNYALNGHNTALKTQPKIKDAQIHNCDYRDLEIPQGSLVYCDPPYKGTTKYDRGFSSEEFWQWARELSKTCDVYVSEYQAPTDFEEVFSIERNLEMRRNKTETEKRVEKIFRLKNART